MVNLLFLIQGPDRPASRYRVLQFLDYLDAHGLAPVVKTFPRYREDWRALDPLLAEADIVFVQKKRLAKRREKQIREHGCRIVFDVDDAVMFRSSRHGSHASWTRMQAFRRACRGADLVIAGNDYLKGLAEPFSSRVEVVPTSIDTSRYRVHDHNEPSDRIVIGWVGGRKSLPFLEHLGPALKEICHHHPTAILKVVCNQFPSLDGVPTEEVVWTEETEAEQIATFDVGLAPLPDDVWSRGKCATKLLQCMAAGVPCVASAVGAHNQIVDPGINGYLAADDTEWVDGLDALIRDAEKRAGMARLCRLTVEEGYSVAAQQPRLLEMLRSLIL